MRARGPVQASPLAGAGGEARKKTASTMRAWLDQKGSDPVIREVAYKQLLDKARTREGVLVKRRDLDESMSRRYSALTTAWADLNKKERDPNERRASLPEQIGKALKKWIKSAQGADDQKGLSAPQLASLIAASKLY